MTDNRAVATRKAVTPTNIEDLQFKVNKLTTIYKNMMEEGVDYGVIPGVKKPFLFRNGAEILRLGFELSCTFHEIEHTVEPDDKLIRSRFMVEIYNWEGKKLGEGYGTCSSLETKYRYRWLYSYQLPLEWKEVKDKIGEWAAQYGPTSTKFIKGKSGSVPMFRIENPDVMELEHTITVMAKKRCFADGIKMVTGAGRIFLSHDEVAELPPEVQEEASRVEDEQPDEKQPKTEQNGMTKDKFMDSIQTFQDILEWTKDAMDKWLYDKTGATSADKVTPQQRMALLKELDKLSKQRK